MVMSSRDCDPDCAPGSKGTERLPRNSMTDMHAILRGATGPHEPFAGGGCAVGGEARSYPAGWAYRGVMGTA